MRFSSDRVVLPTCPMCGVRGIHGTVDECIRDLKMVLVGLGWKEERDEKRRRYWATARGLTKVREEG